MAQQIKIVKRNDFSGDIDSLTLVDAGTGFALVEPGWVPSIAADGDEFVTEVLPLSVDPGESATTLATQFTLIDTKMQEMGYYEATQAERYGIWIRAQAEMEANARQALMTNAQPKFSSSLFSFPAGASPGGIVPKYSLGFDRTPWWESVSARTLTESAIHVAGEQGDLLDGGWPATVEGTKPARIALTTLEGTTGTSVGEVWLGFRTDRWGDRSNFASVWNCEDGSLTNDTTPVVVGTALGGYVAECDFAGTATMAKRVLVELQDVTANYQDQRGQFHVLLRATVGASTTCYVKLLDGYVSTPEGEWRTQGPVKIGSASTRLYPLGTVSIPPVRGHVGDEAFQTYSLRLDAERTAGSTVLQMDALILIPFSEGFMYGSLFSIAPNWPSKVMCYPDGSVGAWHYRNGMPYTRCSAEASRYTMPTGNVRAVVAAQPLTGYHNPLGAVSLEFKIFERWRTLEGNP